MRTGLRFVTSAANRVRSSRSRLDSRFQGNDKSGSRRVNFRSFRRIGCSLLSASQ